MSVEVPFQLRDVDDETVEALLMLAEALNGADLSGSGNPSSALGAGGQFFATGENRVAAPAKDDDWEKINFPFAARGLIIRHYDDLRIAFQNPNQNGSTVVLEGAGSYEIGGQPPLLAETMWYKTADTADVTNATFRVEGL